MKLEQGKWYYGTYVMLNGRTLKWRGNVFQWQKKTSYVYSNRYVKCFCRNQNHYFVGPQNIYAMTLRKATKREVERYKINCALAML